LGALQVKLTKSRLIQIIKEELQNFSIVVEEEEIDLSKMEPVVDDAVKDVLNNIQRTVDNKEAQRVMLSALIAKLSQEIEQRKD